jgi:hypothetical protein
MVGRRKNVGRFIWGEFPLLDVIEDGLDASDLKLRETLSGHHRPYGVEENLAIQHHCTSLCQATRRRVVIIIAQIWNGITSPVRIEGSGQARNSAVEE